jgi:hypothetical protein
MTALFADFLAQFDIRGQQKQQERYELSRRIYQKRVIRRRHPHLCNDSSLDTQKFRAV